MTDKTPHQVALESAGEEFWAAAVLYMEPNTVLRMIAEAVQRDRNERLTPPTSEAPTHDQFGYSLAPEALAARIERSHRDLLALRDQPKINGNDAEVLTSARQLILTLANLAGIR